MMQASDHGYLDDAALVGVLHRSGLRCVLVQGEVCAGTVVVEEIVAQQPWVGRRRGTSPASRTAGRAPSRRLVPAHVVPPARRAGWPLDKCAKGPGVVLRDP